MFLLHGDAKYIDVLERALYNSVISRRVARRQGVFLSEPALLARRLRPQQVVRLLVLPDESVPVHSVGARVRVRGGRRWAVRESVRRGHGRVGSRRQEGARSSRRRSIRGTATSRSRSRRKRRATSLRSTCGFPAGRTAKRGRRDLYSYLDESNERPTLAVNGEASGNRTGEGLRGDRPRVASRATR